jgi:predicted RND superfamily exporter protein
MTSVLGSPTRREAMNKIVREHYPVERLPEDLRAELGLARTVTVVIETEEDQSRSTARAAAVRELLEHRRQLVPSVDDPVERVRKLRDEWDS